MADTSADSRKGQVIEGRYRIIDRIASGGMGVVYRAERLQLGRTVAVKFLDAANAADENSRARFEREAKAMSRLSHPHCVSVIDFGVADTPFIVMEYVTGQPLLDLIHTKKRVKAVRAVAIMKQVMAGLAHAHRHEVIHRDVKPANIMLTDATGTGDFVRILDFGLAKLRGASSLSSANIVVGTPSYMSPEQATGKTLDARSDVYSAGVVLFELLTGTKPFVAEDAFNTLRMHSHEPVPMLPEILGTDATRIALDGVIQKAMAKKPADRFQTALSMAEALGRIEDSARDLRRPHGKRSVSKRDPARATTQLETAAAVVPERTGTEEISVERSASGGGVARTLLLLVFLGAAGVAVWKYREYRKSQVASAPGDEVSQVAAARPDAAPRRLSGLEAVGGLDAGVTGAAGAAGAADAADAAALDAPPADASLAALDAGASDAFESGDGGPIEDEDEDEDDDVGVLVIHESDGGIAVPTGPARNVKEVLALVKAGEEARALRDLRALIAASPKNAYFHRTMGDLQIARGWWTEGLKSYTTAVRLKPRYKRFRSINENAISAIALPKVRRRAERFIRYELGRNALPFLRSAARVHESPTVRKRAQWLADRLR